MFGIGGSFDSTYFWLRVAAYHKMCLAYLDGSEVVSVHDPQLAVRRRLDGSGARGVVHERQLSEGRAGAERSPHL